jgi:predicted enzyme related to lactoylglutathione lyase
VVSRADRRAGLRAGATRAVRLAAERIKAKGGQIINGPHEVPGGQWIVQALDPQGAMFALVAPKR